MKKIYDFVEKCQPVLDKILIVSCTYILIYQIDIIRNVCKEIIEYINFVSCYFLKSELIDKLWLKNTYHDIEKWVFIIICIIVTVKIIWGFLKKNTFEKYQYNLKGDNHFEKNLLKYLNDDKSKNSYLIAGDWGSGKTYIVSEFFKKYNYCFSNKTYRVSCFGLDTREAIIHELNSEIEKKDTGLYKTILEFMPHIPIIGNILFDLLKKEYTIDDISEQSIIVFDDFERVTSRGMDNLNKQFFYRQPDVPSQHSVRDFHDEIGSILSYLETVNDRFEMVYEAETFLISQIYQEKYNAIVGYINELVENKNMKVIVLCNIDILGYNYVDKIFRGKLDCITYYKEAKIQSIDSIFTDVINKTVFFDNKIKEIITRVWNQEKEIINENWNQKDNKNLRNIKRFFQAYIDSIVVVGDYLNDIKFVTDLFYCIYIVNLFLTSDKSLRKLCDIPLGGNLGFYLRVLDIPSNQSINNILTQTDIQWTGIDLSSFWLLNEDIPQDIDLIYDKIESYQYMDIEKDLYNNRYRGRENELPDNGISMIHMGYILKSINLHEYPHVDQLVNKLDYVKYENCSAECILDEYEHVRPNRYTEPFEKAFFKKIYEITGEKNVQKVSTICNSYNRWMSEQEASE